MRFLALLVLAGLNVSAATRYVDSIASGANNGTSWANAWQTIGAITGLSAGDTVYISGGPSGMTQTYSMAAYWNPTSGSSGNRITYQIGQDASHNGTAIFNYTGGSPSGNPWLSGPTHVTVSGDAGDGLKHFRITSYTLGMSNIQNVTVEYVEALTGILQFADIRRGGSTTTGIEIGYCYVKATDTSVNNVIYAEINGADWNDSSIHHCHLLAPQDPDREGFGGDVIAGGGIGLSIYNNTIESFSDASYAAGQHQDGWQGLGVMSKLKFYNNDFINLTNYAIYGEAFNGDFTDVLVYNNIVRFTDSTLTARTNAGGIIFGSSGTGTRTFTRVIIANNTITDFGTTSPAIALNDVDVDSTGVFTDCVIANNVYVNSAGGINITGNATTTPVDNVGLTSGQGAANFSSYSVNGAANNYHLLPGATSLIAEGTDLSAYFTTDADGLTRSVPWDIGAYKYNAGLFTPAASRLRSSGVGVGP